MTESNRREFLVATAAVGGGMALSLYLPEVHAEDKVVGAQVNARPWLPPDDGASRLIRGSSSAPMTAFSFGSISRKWVRAYSPQTR